MSLYHCRNGVPKEINFPVYVCGEDPDQIFLRNVVFQGVGVPVVPSGSAHALEANYLETGIVYANKIVPGLEVIKLFSCSSQPSMHILLLIESKILKSSDFFLLKTLRCCIYPALTFISRISFILS